MTPLHTNLHVAFATDAKRTSVLELDDKVLVGLYIPAVTGTHLTFETAHRDMTRGSEPVSTTTTDWYPVQSIATATGVAIDWTFVAAGKKYLAIPPETFLGCSRLRIVFTTDQVADVDIVAVTTTWGI